MLAVFLSSFSLLCLAQAKSELPPILDYYPNCSYEVVEKTKVKIITKTPLSSKVVNKLLKKIRVKARNANADAVILTAKEVKKHVDPAKGLMGSNSGNNNAILIKNAAGQNNYIIRYHAELINLCDNNNEVNNDNKQKRTPLNHQGMKIISAKPQVVGTRNKTMIIAREVKVDRPVISNDEVSLENGIYGIDIGSSYQHVVSMLGKPSVTLKLMVDEVVLGYGRRHWFYFQSNKLVKIQNNSVYLSQDLVNRIPFFDFFDDFPWQINKKIVYKMPLEDVKAALNISAELNNQDQIVLKNHKNTLTLNFIFDTEKYSSEKSYQLSSFTLQKNDYQQKKQRITEQSNAQFKVIGQLYSQLRHNKNVHTDGLLKKLGAPIGSIALSTNADLQIYNHNLLILVKRDEVKKIHLIENTLANDQHHRWSLGEIKQGTSVEKSEKYLAKEAIILDDKVEVNTENYDLSLIFEKLGNEFLVYEAQLTIY